MSKPVSSPDISTLDFSVLFDISGAEPHVSVTNMSTGITDVTNLQWAFDLLRPSQYPIHQGNFTTPDIDSLAFTTFNFTEKIPTPWRQIEFDDKNGYGVTVYVKDSNGDIFSLTKAGAISKPNGLSKLNNFGQANIDIQTKCELGQLYVTDKTNLIYKSLAGTKVSTEVKLIYPLDTNGNQFSVSPVSQLPCLLPLKYDGTGYNIYVAHVFDYDLGDGFKVRIRYSFNETFDVACNVNLQPLLSQVGLLADVVRRSCNEDTADNRQKRNDISLAGVYLVQATMGIFQPLSKVDVPAKVAAVKEILGIDCDCRMPAGLSNIGTSLFTDATVTVNKICGDLLLSWENDGEGNITLNYQGVSYTFVMSDVANNSEAFDFQTAFTDAGCTKQVSFFVDKAILASEILTEITNNQTLLNILNGITQRAQLSCTGLNGKTVFTANACDYNAEMSAGPTGSSFVAVTIGGVRHLAPTGTLLNNASAIQTYLNSLSLGTFVVAYASSPNKTTITSAANTNVLATVEVLIGSTTKVISFSNNCGLICTILQKIIDYLSAINLFQVGAGGTVGVCSFDVDGTLKTTNFDNTDSAGDVITEVVASLCSIVNYTKDKLLNCVNLQNLFATFTTTTGDPNGTDIFFMNMNGKCQKVPLKNAAIAIVRQIVTDSDVRAQFCQIPPCSSVSLCAPVQNLTAGAGTDTTQSFTWNTVVGAIGYKYSKDGTNYTQVSSTSAYLSGLTPNTSYTFHVYPVYISGPGSACDVTATFVTSNSGAVCAAPGSLVLDNVTDTAFRATWAAVTGASGYRYRVNGGSWVSLGVVLSVDVTGLTANTSYNFEVAAIISGTACPTGSSASTTTGFSTSENLTLTNNVPSASFVSAMWGSVSFYTHSSGDTLPLANGQTERGIHGGFAGGIRINVTGAYATSKAILYVNSAAVQCIDISSPGLHDFSTASYVAGDQIAIILSVGTCGGGG